MVATLRLFPGRFRLPIKISVHGKHGTRPGIHADEHRSSFALTHTGANKPQLYMCALVHEVDRAAKRALESRTETKDLHVHSDIASGLDSEVRRTQYARLALVAWRVGLGI